MCKPVVLAQHWGFVAARALSSVWLWVVRLGLLGLHWLWLHLHWLHLHLLHLHLLWLHLRHLHLLHLAEIRLRCILLRWRRPGGTICRVVLLHLGGRWVLVILLWLCKLWLCRLPSSPKRRVPPEPGALPRLVPPVQLRRTHLVGLDFLRWLVSRETLPAGRSPVLRLGIGLEAMGVICRPEEVLGWLVLVVLIILIWIILVVLILILTLAQTSPIPVEITLGHLCECQELPIRHLGCSLGLPVPIPLGTLPVSPLTRRDPS